jgi:hypothetical protein
MHIPSPEVFKSHHHGLSESDNAYPALTLNARWRIIACRDDVQWIVQFRNRRHDAETVSNSDWRGRSYCRTRDGLIASCDRLLGGQIDPAARAALAALPKHFRPGCLPVNTETETNGRDVRRVRLAA